jgi:Tol biopolymer transport system component
METPNNITGAIRPFWSPDGRSLGFFADGKLKRVDLGGGLPQTLADAPYPLGGSWNSDGVIIFAPAPKLFRVSATGGAATPLHGSANPFDDRTNESWPHFLPDGRHFLFYLNPKASPGLFTPEPSIQTTSV